VYRWLAVADATPIHTYIHTYTHTHLYSAKIRENEFEALAHLLSVWCC